MNIEKKCEEFMSEAQKLGYSEEDALYYLFRFFVTTTFGDVEDFKDFVNYYRKKQNKRVSYE